MNTADVLFNVLEEAGFCNEELRELGNVKKYPSYYRLDLHLVGQSSHFSWTYIGYSDFNHWYKVFWYLGYRNGTIIAKVSSIKEQFINLADPDSFNQIKMMAMAL